VPSRHPRRSGWLLAVAAAVLACLAYLNALDNPFVYDDHDTVLANRSLVDLSNLRFILVYTPFRPLVNASYALDRWIWDYRPFGYHLTSVALHALTVVLLYVWMRRILDDTTPGADATLPAFAGAALFAVHPIQTEAVGYVSGRSEVLSAVWFMTALLLGRSAVTSGRRVSAVLGVVAGVLALASKETALALPVVFLAYDWLLRPGTDEGRRRRLWLVAVPLLVLAAAAGGYRFLAMNGPSNGVMTAVLNAMTQSIVIWRYVGLIVWPFGQSIMHSVHRVTHLADPFAWIAIAALLLTCVIGFRLRRSDPVSALGIAWFLAVLAPSSSFLPLREGMAEHRVYLASAGLFVVISSIVRRRTIAMKAPQYSIRLAVGVAVSILCVLTVMRNRVWSDPITLWSAATLYAEGMWEPRYALADSLREAGQCAAAVPEYRKVVALRPAHRDGHTNLGICLAETGHLDEAEREFRRALEIDPSYARGYTNLGALALMAGDATRARDFYREAIGKDPNNVLARMQLASLYENTFHDYHSAARMCGEARLLAPSTPGVVDCVERNQRRAVSEGR
jgi:cytochrome c-type biogenesis protein CcmH/NrfG